MSLTSLLPAPKHATVEVIESPHVEQQAAPAYPEAPPYGKRGKFVPRTPEDFGDGGAFPEIHVVQYPLDMGRKDKKSKSGVVALQVDAEGNVTYDGILRQNMRTEMRLYSKYTDMLEKDVAAEDLAKPSEEEVMKAAEKTRAALGQLVDQKLAAARPTTVNTNTGKDPTFIRYTPSQQHAEHNSGATQRIIRLQEMPVDPLEPPKFKHTKVPGGPPSPPAPVMHSPPRKMSVQDQQNWKIPPSISNWKNIKGYTISLDKRLAADGRGLQEMQVNDNFAKLSEALYIAERTARKEIGDRAKMMKAVEAKKVAAHEETIRLEAQNARRMAAVAQDEDEDESEDENDVEARDRRDELRKERARDLRRELRMESMAEDRKKGKTVSSRDNDRDISEQIALGKSAGKSKDLAMDQRLFNQDQGMGAGFGDGTDDAYNVYDKPLFNSNKQQYIYRGKEGDADVGGEGAVENLLKSTSRFTAGDRGFKGTEDGGRARDKPVAFEKEEADPFGLGDTFADREKHDTLDKIGRKGAMSAAAGGSRLNAEDDRLQDHSNKRVDFEESRSSRRGRSRSRSRSRGRRRRRSRSRSRSRDRKRRR